MDNNTSTDKQAIPDGYKATKVGVFPKDWNGYSIKALLIYSKIPLAMKNDEQYNLITIKRNYGGIVSRGLFYGKKVLVKTQFKLKAGDFVISKRQISHGACGVVPDHLDGSIVSNEYNVFKNNCLLNTDYFNYFTQLPRMKRLFYLMSDGVHIEKLLFKTDSWLKQKISVPVLLEQRKIATILSTQDKVIELKEKLLNEKQKQKKYLMQVLLNPDSPHFKRLDGFGREWEKEKLGNVFKSTRGTGLSKALICAKGENPCVLYGELYTTYDEVIDQIRSYTNANRGVLSQVGDLLMPSSTTTTGIDLANATALNKKNVLLGGDIIILRGKDVSNIFYAYYISNCKKFKIAALAQGVTIIHLYYRDIKNVVIDIPKLDEQDAIVNVLATIDREMNCMKNELEKQKQKQKALMQMLLTGKMRVNV